MSQRSTSGMISLPNARTHSIDGGLTSPNSFANFKADDNKHARHMMSAILRTADVCIPVLQVR
jgi:hypothetical protein